MINQSGALNTTALTVPGLYVQIVPPQNLLLNGVPTDVLGVVGTATWGPVNTPVIVATMQNYAASFGPVMNRAHDLGTDVMIAVQQGAANMRCVRVTDGTDTAATMSILSSMTVTALYTGSMGNYLSLTLSAGSAANTWKFTAGISGLVPEVYDNIAGTGSAFWTNLAAAINSGNGVLRGPSGLIRATATGSTAPAAGTFLMNTGTLGTDGATTITDTVIVGSDAATPRTGMYALRGQGCGVAILAGVNGFTNAAAMLSFGLSEGVYVVGAGPAGDTISNAVSAKASAAADSYALKLMFGDWVYWQDTVNNVLRLVSPAPFVAGRLVNMTPNHSSLNKPLYNILSTQKAGIPGSGAADSYASADLSVLFQAGIDVIGNPSPGGSYWSCLLGHNTSSNAAINGDNYTRMTNYIASTINAGMGKYVGQVITSRLFLRIAGTLTSYFDALVQQGLLGTSGAVQNNGSTAITLPYAVTCNASNNPPSRTALGYVQADCQVQYQGINEKFIVNLEGGETVVIAQSTGAIL